MAKTINFVVLALMLVAFAVGIAVRSRSAHTMPVAATPEPTTLASVSSAASANAPPSTAAPTAARPSAAPTASSAEATPKRSLRVVGLGWEGLAAGVMANDGTEPGKNSAFDKANLTVHIASKRTAEAVENALARGGKDAEGADIAIMPLQRFVASYERLKALDPVIFFVVAWSEGREVVLSKKRGFSVAGDVKVFGDAGSAAAFVGLFALDLAGTSPDHVKLVDKPDSADFAAITRQESKSKSEQANGDLLLTTAEASRLVPLVAIAQRSLVDNEPAALARWAQAWLDGHKRVSLDASETARKIAEAKGGPEPLEVLASLGELAPATLAENAEVAGLSGRGAVSLEALFQRTWAIWRQAKVLTVPPEKAPVEPSIVAALVRGGGELTGPSTPPGAKTRAVSGAEPLIVHHEPKGALDLEVLISQTGFLAGVFRRSPIRLTVHPHALVDKKATDDAVAQAIERFALPEGRLSAGQTRGPVGSPATIEIMPIP